MMKKVCAFLLAALLLLSLAACGAHSEPEPAVKSQENTAQQQTPAPSSAPEPEPESAAKAEELVDGLRPSIKSSMDEYESFYQLYQEVMTIFQTDPTDETLIAQRDDMLERAANMDEEFENTRNSDLNIAEQKYLEEVRSRISEIKQQFSE